VHQVSRNVARVRPIRVLCVVHVRLLVLAFATLVTPDPTEVIAQVARPENTKLSLEVSPAQHVRRTRVLRLQELVLSLNVNAMPGFMVQMGVRARHVHKIQALRVTDVASYALVPATLALKDQVEVHASKC
jgi:hypothetical protein